jgi:hypothetical protein
VPLHEWKYEVGYSAQSSIDENGEIVEIKAPVENIITCILKRVFLHPVQK